MAKTINVFLLRLIKDPKFNVLLNSGLNQALSSGTNFLIGLYLVSYFSPSTFGIYGICFAILLFIGSTGNAFFLTQMVVLYPLIEKGEQKNFILGVFYLISLFCVILFLFALLLILLNSTLNLIPFVSSDLVLSVIYATSMYLIKEFLVRTSYNIQQEQIAVYIHLTIGLSALIFFGSEFWFIGNLSNTDVFLLYGTAHLFGAIIGLVLLKIKLLPLGRIFLLRIFRELWIDGKWGTMTNIVYCVRSQAHTLIATFIMGPVGVGTLNAARLFITPGLMAIPIVSQLALPRLSKVRETNRAEVFIKGKWLTAVYLSLVLVYSLLILTVYDTVVLYFLDLEYKNLFYLTSLWCLYALALAFRNAQDIIVQVLQKFRKLTLVNSISAVVTLGFVYSLSYTWGLFGNVAGLIVGEIFLVIWLRSILKTKS